MGTQLHTTRYHGPSTLNTGREHGCHFRHPCSTRVVWTGARVHEYDRLMSGFKTVDREDGS